MTKNEVKKALYIQKPIAKEVDIVPIDNLTGVEPYSVYMAQLKTFEKVRFVIPHKEMGEQRFSNEVPAQLLIRWLKYL